MGVISRQKHLIPLFSPFKLWHGIGWHLTAKNDIIASVILGILGCQRNHRSCKEPTGCFRRQCSKNTNTKGLLTVIPAPQDTTRLCLPFGSHTLWRAMWFQEPFKAQKTLCLCFLKMPLQVCSRPCRWSRNPSWQWGFNFAPELSLCTRLGPQQRDLGFRGKHRKFCSHWAIWLCHSSECVTALNVSLFG